jgi:hypothetical protein
LTIVRIPEQLESTTFRNADLLPCSSGGTENLLGPLERVHLNDWKAHVMLTTATQPSGTGRYLGGRMQLPVTDNAVPSSLICFTLADHATPLYPHKLALNFVDKSRSLSRYSSLAE